MRRYPVLLLASAFSDLDNIGRFIFEKGASESVALSFVERIRKRCETIGDAPEGYPLRPELGSDVRTVPFERSGTIAYRFREDTVQIVRVFYGGQDLNFLI